MKIRLKWMEDNELIIEEVSLARLITLGRSTMCDVQIDQPTVSRQHAFLYVIDHEVYIQNVSNTNAIRIGNMKLKSNETAVLREGDYFVLGRLRVLVTAIEEEPAGRRTKVRCCSCNHIVPAHYPDCHWCGASLAFAETATFF